MTKDDRWAERVNTLKRILKHHIFHVFLCHYIWGFGHVLLAVTGNDLMVRQRGSLTFWPTIFHDFSTFSWLKSPTNLSKFISSKAIYCWWNILKMSITRKMCTTVQKFMFLSLMLTKSALIGSKIQWKQYNCAI